MGTRGVWGFRKNGHTIVTYHHFDSYPEGLGYSFVQFLKDNTNDQLSEAFDNIKEINVRVKPTDEQKQYCIDMGWFDGYVSDRSSDDWYCLLHKLQEPEQWQDAMDQGKEIYVDNYTSFLKDSLFCEYGYIYDIDCMMLEFYEGFQKKPQIDNPYGNTPNEDGYYPCRVAGLMMKWDIDDAPIDDIVKCMIGFGEDVE